jgi:hypothetical protein
MNFDPQELTAHLEDLCQEDGKLSLVILGHHLMDTITLEPNKDGSLRIVLSLQQQWEDRYVIRNVSVSSMEIGLTLIPIT